MQHSGLLSVRPPTPRWSSRSSLSPLLTTAAAQLPHHLLPRILAFLPLHTLGQVACVSRALRAALDRVLDQDPERHRAVQVAAAHHATVRIIRGVDPPPCVQLLSDRAPMCCSHDGTEVLQLRTPLPLARRRRCARVSTCALAGLRPGEHANLLVIRSRFSTDDPSLRDSQELLFSVPPDNLERAVLTSKSWAPDGDHVVIWAPRAMCLRLSACTCTIVSPERVNGVCLDWSPDNTALMYHGDYDANPNHDSITLWDPTTSQEAACMSAAAYADLTSSDELEFEFIAYPTAVFVPGGFLYISAPDQGGLVEWNYRTGHHRFLGHIRDSLLLKPAADGRSVIWHSKQSIALQSIILSTAPAAPIVQLTRPAHPWPQADSWVSASIHCGIVNYDPVTFAFHCGDSAHPLRVLAPEH